MHFAQCPDVDARCQQEIDCLAHPRESVPIETSRLLDVLSVNGDKVRPLEGVGQ